MRSITSMGVCIQSAKSFTCCFDKTKKKFFRTFNALYSKCKGANSEMPCIQVLKSHCLPIVLYACEAFRATNAQVKTLNNFVNLAVMKIFGVTESASVKEIRIMFGLHDIDAIIGLRRITFMRDLNRSDDTVCNLLHDLCYKDLMMLCAHYDVLPDQAYNRLKVVMYK